MIGRSKLAILTWIMLPTATVQAELIGQVAEEAELSPEAVERVLQLTAESVQQATERHTQILLGRRGTGKTAALVTLMMASIAGSLVGVLLIATRRGTMKYALPFGTFLAMGAVLAVVFGPGLLNWYLGLLKTP